MDKRCAVLIVEDDENLRNLLRKMLERHSSSVDVATDGERAIEMVRDGTYDFVILDLMLPKKNGFLVADAIASLANKPKVIVLSAVARYFGDRFPAGTLVLQKPFEIDKVEDAIRSVRV